MSFQQTSSAVVSQEKTVANTTARGRVSGDHTLFLIYEQTSRVSCYLQGFGWHTNQ